MVLTNGRRWLQGEVVLPEEEHFKLHPIQIDDKKLELDMQKADFTLQFQELKTKYTYLKSLSIQESNQTEPQPCPICHDVLGPGKDKIVRPPRCATADTAAAAVHFTVIIAGVHC